MRDAGLELKLAIAQDLCLMRLLSCCGAWSGVDVSVSSRSSRCLPKRRHRARTFRQSRRHGLLPAQVYKWRRLAELGVTGVPGASELPSFVAVEITRDVPSLPAPVLEEPTAVNDAPCRWRHKKAGLIEIELESGRRVRVDRHVDAAPERVLDVLARRRSRFRAAYECGWPV